MKENTNISADNEYTDIDATQLRQALRWLYSFVQPHRRQVVVIMIMSLTTTLLVLLQPYLTKILIDDGLLAGDFSLLVTVALSIFAVGLVSTGLAGANRYSCMHNNSPTTSLKVRAGEERWCRSNPSCVSSRKGGSPVRSS